MTPDELDALKEAQLRAFKEGPKMTPHPHGLPGRIADAHAEEKAAIAEGNIDAAVGSAMLASALTTAYIAELEQQHGAQ